MPHESFILSSTHLLALLRREAMAGNTMNISDIPESAEGCFLLWRFPVCLGTADLFRFLPHTHTANTHTHHVTGREGGRERRRRRGKRRVLSLLHTWAVSICHASDQSRAFLLFSHTHSLKLHHPLNFVFASLIKVIQKQKRSRN